MALTKEEKAAAKAAQMEAGTSDASGETVDETLVEVSKDGETIAVHPTCLAAHLAIGWKAK